MNRYWDMKGFVSGYKIWIISHSPSCTCLHTYFTSWAILPSDVETQNLSPTSAVFLTLTAPDSLAYSLVLRLQQ